MYLVNRNRSAVVGCCLAVWALTAAWSPSPARACNTPVFRYAMYNWPAAPYYVFYFHHGGPAEEDAEVNKKIEEQIGKPAADQPADANGGATAKLQVLSGANSGKELALTKALTTIGRPGQQVAAITRRPQGYFIIHVEGGDGSFPTINGQQIGTQAQALNDHDIIEVAGVKMEFFLG